jgi:hypothetical protein
MFGVLLLVSPTSVRLNVICGLRFQPVYMGDILIEGDPKKLRFSIGNNLRTHSASKRAGYWDQCPLRFGFKVERADILWYYRIGTEKVRRSFFCFSRTFCAPSVSKR